MYTFTTDFGNNTILAPCLAALCAEIAVKYPDAVNLGEIGDASHRTEGYGSDHNPFIAHAGKRYVRAIDIGGPDSIQSALFAFIMERYVQQDSRVFPYGYVHRNNVITTWFGHGSTHTDPGDVGHLHISVTQKDGYNPRPSGWVAALDSTAPWGLVQEDDMTEIDAVSLTAAKSIGDAVATSVVNRGLGGAGYDGNVAQMLVDYHQTQHDTNKKLDQLIALLTPKP